MGDIEKKKRGRPKKEGAMRERLHMTMDDDMARRLDNLSHITGMAKSDIIREAFDGYEKLKILQQPEPDYEAGYWDYDEEIDDLDE